MEEPPIHSVGEEFFRVLLKLLLTPNVRALSVAVGFLLGVFVTVVICYGLLKTNVS